MNQPYIPSSASVHPQENLQCTSSGEPEMYTPGAPGMAEEHGLGTSHTYGQTLLHLLPALPPWTCNLTPGPQLFQMKHGDQKIESHVCAY